MPDCTHCAISNLEASWIGKAIKEKTSVLLFTKNGYQMKGRIEKQDSRCILFAEVSQKNETEKMNLIYKEAISTIQFPDNFMVDM